MTALLDKKTTSKSEHLLSLLAALDKDIKKYSEGKVSQEAIYSQLDRLNTLFNQDEEYFQTTFAEINTKFSEPLEPPSRVKALEEHEKGLIKKYGFRHPSINNLASFYERQYQRAVSMEERDGVSSPFDSAENFPAQLRTFIEEIVNQVERARSLKRKDKDKQKKQALTSCTYELLGIITPVANNKGNYKLHNGSSISIGRAFRIAGSAQLSR